MPLDLARTLDAAAWCPTCFAYSWRNEWKRHVHQVGRCPVCRTLGTIDAPPLGPLGVAAQRGRASVSALRLACDTHLVVNESQ